MERQGRRSTLDSDQQEINKVVDGLRNLGSR